MADEIQGKLKLKSDEYVKKITFINMTSSKLKIDT